MSTSKHSSLGKLIRMSRKKTSRDQSSVNKVNQYNESNPPVAVTSFDDDAHGKTNTTATTTNRDPDQRSHRPRQRSNKQRSGRSTSAHRRQDSRIHHRKRSERTNKSSAERTSKSSAERTHKSSSSDRATRSTERATRSTERGDRHRSVSRGRKAASSSARKGSSDSSQSSSSKQRIKSSVSSHHRHNRSEATRNNKPSQHAHNRSKSNASRRSRKQSSRRLLENAPASDSSVRKSSKQAAPKDVQDDDDNANDEDSETDTQLVESDNDSEEEEDEDAESGRAPVESVQLRDNFKSNLHSELLSDLKILLEATFYKQGKRFGQWNKRFFRLENDGSKPILLYWLNSSCADFQKYNPRGALDLSNSRVIRVSPTILEIENAFDLQKIDDTTFPLSNKCVTLKLKGGEDAIKSLGDVVDTYVRSAEEGTTTRKYAAISQRPSTFLEQYELKEELGRGGFAVVYKAIDRHTNQEVAVKQLKLGGFTDREELERHLKGVENEIKIMSIVTKVFPDNPNLLKIRGVFHEPQEQSTYIVMDLMTGGELFDRIVEKSRYTESDAAHLFYDMIKALRLLHKVGIVHRDLKPENIIFASEAEDATLKIADFGAAYVLGREEDDIHHGKRIGSPGYFAPEVYRMKYGLAGDIWSMGVILYCMLVGYPPFDAESEAELMMMVITCQYEFHEEYWSGISEDAKDLIRKMLCPNIADRLTCDQVLAHPWFSSIHKTKENVRLDETVGRLRVFNSNKKVQNTVSALNVTRSRVQEQFLRAALGRAVVKVAKRRMFGAAQSARNLMTKSTISSSTTRSSRESRVDSL